MVRTLIAWFLFGSLVWTVAGCAPGTSTESTISDGQAGTVSSANALFDRYVVDTADLAQVSGFWRSLAQHGVGEVEGFKTLEEMTRASDLVVIGQLGEMIDGPVVVPDEGEESAPVKLRAVEIRLLEVLAGSAGGGDSILFRGGFLGVLDDSAAHRGPAILFLRSGAAEFAVGAVMPDGEARDWFSESYRLVSLQGAYLATSQGMLNPLSEEQYQGSDSIAQDWVGNPVDAFIDAIRQADQTR